MKDIRRENELLKDEIGAIAKALDRDLSASERMRIRKSTLHRLAIAFSIYAGAMALMAAFL